MLVFRPMHTVAVKTHGEEHITYRCFVGKDIHVVVIQRSNRWGESEAKRLGLMQSPE